MTPLHLAAENGHENIVKVLIQAGANVNVVDRWDGKTPLDPSYGLDNEGRHRNRGLFRLHGIGNQDRKNMN